MSLINLHLDLSALASLADIGERAEELARREAQLLLAQTHGHIVEEAARQLRSRRQAYVDALSFYEEDGVYVVNLDQKALWIEEGQEAFSMLPGLLNSPKAKTAADGHRYMVVPFTHDQGPAVASTAQRQVVGAVRTAMKAAGIPFGKIEHDSGGNPKIGLLHDLKVDSPRKQVAGPGWGQGPVGEQMQGRSGTPILKGAKVYQTATPGGGVRRGVVTFRVASEDGGGWEHPGNKPLKLLDEAGEWARAEWEKNIVPRIVAELSNR